MSKVEEEQSVLEGLDQVEWHTLEYAYREADDVPPLLRDLESVRDSISNPGQGVLYGDNPHKT